METKTRPSQEYTEMHVKTLGGVTGQEQSIAFRHYGPMGILQFSVVNKTEFGSNELRGHLSLAAIQELKGILGLQARKLSVLVRITAEGIIDVYSNDGTIDVRVLDATRKDDSPFDEEELRKITEAHPIKLK